MVDVFGVAGAWVEAQCPLSTLKGATPDLSAQQTADRLTSIGQREFNYQGGGLGGGVPILFLWARGFF